MTLEGFDIGGCAKFRESMRFFRITSPSNASHLYSSLVSVLHFLGVDIKFDLVLMTVHTVNSQYWMCKQYLALIGR